MQRTLPTLGLDPIVPFRPHRDDRIITVDGIDLLRSDAFEDCKGEFHSTDELRHESDVTIVTDILNDIDKWVCEYTTSNEDYPDGYLDYIVGERGNVFAAIKEWLNSNNPPSVRELIEDFIRDGDIELPEVDEDEDQWDADEYAEHLACNVRINDLAEAMCDDCVGAVGFEYEGSDYRAYFGNGILLGSFSIDEYENQLDIVDSPELQELHDRGVLDDVLDDVNCDAYVNRSRRRVKNEETGRYEEVGRPTYDNGGDYPCLMTYHIPGGQWQFVVDDECAIGIMEEKLLEILLDSIR